MNLAKLGIIVDASGTIRQLNTFTGSAHNAGKAGDRLEQSANRVNRAFGALGAYFGISQLVEYADTWTLIGARIDLVTDSTEQQIAIQQRLYEIAQRTRNTMSATSVLYTRIALNADQLGRTHNELLGVVSAVNSAMLISGATGVEAAQSMRQLAQAMGAGRLQGDEFRTVMEAMPAVARAIADEMGVAMGDLYKLSAQGKISVDTIIDALLAAQQRLEEEAASMPMTIGQSFTYFLNASGRMIGVLNEAGGVSSFVADKIRDIANNMNRLIALIGAAAAAWLSYQLAVSAAAISTAIITSAQTIGAFLSLARTVRSVSDAMALLSMTSKGVAGVIGTVIAATVGIVAYRKLLAEIDEETRKWEEAQADLNVKLGEGADRIEEINKAEQKRRWQNEDMVRQAQQAVVLAGLQGRAQEQMGIHYDAVNKIIEARRELTGALLVETVAAIEAERNLLLEAERVAAGVEEANKRLEEQEQIIKNFRDNVQRSFGDLFYNIFNDGINSFGDLFNGIKQMFFRMLAEMAAAKMMQEWGTKFATALAGIFGGAVTAAAQTATTAIPSTAAAGITTTSVSEYEALRATGKEAAMEIEGFTVSVERSASSLEKMAGAAGIALAAFAIGQSVGGTTTNRAAGMAGGAVSGAVTGAILGSIVPGIGTAVGTVIGGLAGAVGGLIGATKARTEMLREHAAILTENNRKLDELRVAFEGAEATRYNEVLDLVTRASGAGGRHFQVMSASDRELIMRMADEMGIEIFDKKGRIVAGALDQLAEAIRLTVRSITEFGDTFEEQRRRQEYRNKIMGVEETPEQMTRDAYDILMSMAPRLMEQMGLAGLDMTTESGRQALEAGVKKIFELVDSGMLTPELLGKFTDKNELLDAIVAVTEGMHAFHQQLSDVTTDFPRAMDIIYYEQLHGRYTTGSTQSSPSSESSSSAKGWTINGGLHVTVRAEPGEDGDEILDKVERAAWHRVQRGGVVDIGQEGHAR